MTNMRTSLSISSIQEFCASLELFFQCAIQENARLAYMPLTRPRTTIPTIRSLGCRKIILFPNIYNSHKSTNTIQDLFESQHCFSVAIFTKKASLAYMPSTRSRTKIPTIRRLGLYKNHPFYQHIRDLLKIIGLSSYEL